MSCGGRVIEIKDMTVSAGRVNRLWCLDFDNGYNDEMCVFSEWYPDGGGPKLGDAVWWGVEKIYFDGGRRFVRKIAYSFKPPQDELI